MRDKPAIISTGMQGGEISISPVFKERFQISQEAGTNHLVIKKLGMSDSATYYCGALEFHTIEFGEGAFLHVRASPSNSSAVVQRPALARLRSGDSLNLSCTAHAGACAAARNLYWFRRGAARPAIVSVAECEYLPNDERHEKECTSNLTLTSVSSLDAGMYYCAVASCGEVEFGKGTRVQIAGGSFFMVYCLSAALAGAIAVLLVLAFVVYELRKKSRKEAVSHLAFSAAADVTNQEAEMYYAALSLNRASERQHTEDAGESACVYSRVKSRKE
ncbi:uncharacterized protein [Clinocottus analis]|uniref:uncharacterized protein n=1 Tax=Clinocottus analis TaxID=304258 RepID=UPI0035C1EFF8